jgi:hypothetical protein
MATIWPFQHNYQLNKNCDLKTRTLAQKTHILGSKTPKSTLFEKVALPVAPFFWCVVKISLFQKVALLVSLFFFRVKITTWLKS